MISYSDQVHDLGADQFDGFFTGWPRSPSRAQLRAVLRQSYRVVVAVEQETATVVGFITAISDGVLTAFIPWLEVLPPHQGRGIGSELLRRMFVELSHLYSVDLTCDEKLARFYRQRGMIALRGMGLRNPNVFTSPSS